MDASEIPDHSNAFRVAKLLGVDGRDLIEALTTKTIFAQGDSVVSNSEKIEFFFPMCCLPFIHSHRLWPAGLQTVQRPSGRRAGRLRQGHLRPFVYLDCQQVEQRCQKIHRSQNQLHRRSGHFRFRELHCQQVEREI